MPRCATWKITFGLLALLALPPAVRAADKVETSIDVAIAWRLEGISGTILGPHQSDAVFHQGLALLEAASRLAPQEPRFLRLRVLALQRLGDMDGAITVLKQYRKLVPADKVAQLQLINLYSSKIETVDARVEYLTSLLDKQDIPVEVRAQVAVQVTSLLLQKSPEQAAAMATRAVQLYPLAEATRQYYRLVGRKLEPLAKRVEALLAVLKADPNQPVYLDELATLLASNGLPNESLLWYDTSIFTILASGEPPPRGLHTLWIDYVAEAAVAGRLGYADTKASQMLERQPLDADAWFLKLAVDKAASAEIFGRQIDPARDTFIRRWNALHDEIISGHAATQPAVVQPVLPGQNKMVPLDAAPVLEKLKDSQDPRQTEATISVVSDLAWFDLYFDPKPQEAGKWVETLKALLPADSVPLQRLEGWLSLVSGDSKKAHEILAPVADKDALAQFGLIRCDQAEKAPVEPKRVTKLLEENRIGVVAAILWTALNTDATRPTTQPAANEVVAVLNKFPGPWLSILDLPSRMYTISAEPVETSVPYGAPVLAEVTITNINDYDITIGNDAILRPELWFDARTLLDQQLLNGIAADQIKNEIVLRAHKSTSQIVRIDVGELHQKLEKSPGAAAPVKCWVTTNKFVYHDPSTNEDVITAGPAGQKAGFNYTFTYHGIPVLIPSGRKQLQDAIVSDDPLERLHAAEVLAGFQRMALSPGLDETIPQAVAALPAKVASMRKDSSPLVGGWVSHISTPLADASECAKIVTEMAASPDWTTRLLSLFSAGSLPIDKRKEIASGLINDPDATVKAAAIATVDVLAQLPQVPSTQPSTEPAIPASQPSTQPALKLQE